MAEEPADRRPIGEEFQERTKYHREASGGGERWTRPFPLKKIYPPAHPRTPLPVPQATGGAGLWDAIRARRSVRSYGAREVALSELSQLLWAGQGITREKDGMQFRAAPSAGALYPIETYAAARKVRSLPPGLYHYEVESRSLALVAPGDRSLECARAAGGQEMCAEAALLLIWTAVVGRSARKYAQRAYRYIYLDAGHLAQNVALACVSLGLGCCMVGALFDDEINAILGVDGRDETVLYMAAIGPIPLSGGSRER
jgi:SagB-type dehydrogenase family enzyme